MTFEQELIELVEQMRADEAPQTEIEAAVVNLHHKHGRELPPPIMGTVAMAESADGFGRQ